MLAKKGIDVLVDKQQSKNGKDLHLIEIQRHLRQKYKREWSQIDAISGHAAVAQTPFRDNKDGLETTSS